MSMVISLCRCLVPMLEAGTSNLEYFFVFALVWCLGGGLSEKDGVDYRKEFSTWWK
jgi:dynein heavy chain